MISNNSIHAGIRCKLDVCDSNTQRKHVLKLFQGVSDLENDRAVGFQLITTDDIEDLGIVEIVRRIRKRVGDTPVYLRSVLRFIAYRFGGPNIIISLDIDVIGVYIVDPLEVQLLKGIQILA